MEGAGAAVPEPAAEAATLAEELAGFVVIVVVVELAELLLLGDVAVPVPVPAEGADGFEGSIDSKAPGLLLLFETSSIIYREKKGRVFFCYPRRCW